MQNKINQLPEDDLINIQGRIDRLWEDLRDKSLFLTGGTGFFGIWFLESFAKANIELGLNSNVMVLTRDPESFCDKALHLAKNPAISFYKGDIRTFVFPKGKFSHIIHGAMTSAEETFYKSQSPLEKYDTIVGGTRRCLEFAAQSGTEKFLLLSSGPVYGRQPSELTHIAEDYCGAPLTTDVHFDFSMLGEGKRVAEMLSTLYAQEHGFTLKIARCFSFVGPGLPLNLHYAIGNFMNNILQQNPIEILGDGSAVRSYLYMSDTMVWLWSLLLGQAKGVYNVGSDNSYSIAEVANIVAKIGKQPCVVFNQTKKIKGAADLYVPSVRKIKVQLGLQQTVGLESAIYKTLNYYK